MDNELKFRKKPVVVTASLWNKNGDHPLDDVWRPFEATGAKPTEPREGAVVRYFRHPRVNGGTSCEHCSAVMHFHGWIETIDTGKDGMVVCPGDWVITGVKGERYPCKPDIFDATYEPADRRSAEAPGVREAEREVIEAAKKARRHLGPAHRCSVECPVFKEIIVSVDRLAAASKPADTKTEPKP